MAEYAPDPSQYPPYQYAQPQYYGPQTQPPQQPAVPSYGDRVRNSFNDWLSNFGNILRTLVFDRTKKFKEQLVDFQLRNALLAFVHAAFFVTVMVFVIDNRISDIVQVRISPVLWSNVTLGGSYSGLTGTKLDTCAKDPDVVTAKWGSGDTWFYQVRATSTNMVPPKWMLLMGFIAITVFAHVMRVLLAQNYFYYVMMYNQPRWDRWSEYAFSSSAMIIIIAGTAGVNDAFLLWTLSTAQFAMLIFGLAIEALDYSRAYVHSFNVGTASQALLGGVDVAPEIPGENQQLSISSIKMPWKIADKQLPASMLSKKRPHMESGIVVGEKVPLMPVPLGEMFGTSSPSYNKVIQWVKTSIFITASWIYVWIWATIWYTFSNVRSKFKCMNEGYKTDAFDIPEVIIYVEFLMFGSFAVAAGLFAFRLKPVGLTDPLTYERAFFTEYVYGMLSLNSKAIITFLLLWEARTMKFS